MSKKSLVPIVLPADPTNPLEAATKQYADTKVSGLTMDVNFNTRDWKQAVKCATTANITLSGLQTIDGYTTLADEVVLVKDQSNQAQNGIYHAKSGAWVRRGDSDQTIYAHSGMACYVERGTVNAKTGWWMTTQGAITIGTTAQVFEKFSSDGTVAIAAEWGSGNGTGGTVLPLSPVKVVPVTSASFKGSGCTLVTNGALTGGIQINKAGTYHITSTVTTTGGGSGYVDAGFAVYRSGSSIYNGTAVGSLPGSMTYSATSSAQTLDLLVGDVVCLVGNSQAGNLAIEARTYLTVQRLTTGANASSTQHQTFVFNFPGPYPTATPSATTGQSFVTTFAGYARGQFSCSAFTTTGAPIHISLWIDGVLMETTVLAAALTLSNHLATPTRAFTSGLLSPGTHYITLRQTSATSDTGDAGSCMLTLSPT
jgi:hypothetical protein